MGIRRLGVGWFCGALLALAACEAEPALVASNCEKGKDCVSRQALKIDAVDILLVIDNSPSSAELGQQLKNELPRLMNAITHGEDGNQEFPPAKSVHVAVTTPDLGAGDDSNIAGCAGWGRDGKFVKPTEFGVTCDVNYPGYLAFEGGPAAIATVETVSCVPLVTPKDVMQGNPQGAYGCGFEQPLEAALKALSKKDSEVEFVHGAGQADGGNKGFLRDDSLLVVVVVSDEDDCSASDYTAFDPQSDTNAVTRSPNAFCHLNQDKLFDPARYVEQLKTLRPDNDNVIFAAIAGVPAEMTSDAYRADFDLATDEGAKDYYASVLEDPAMEERLAPGLDSPHAQIAPSCSRLSPAVEGAGLGRTDAFPPRRLLEVAKGFGNRGVVQSICGDDFGATAGRLIRKIGEQLTAANQD